MTIELIVHPKSTGGMIEFRLKNKKTYVCYFKGRAGQPFVRVNHSNGVNSTYVYDRRRTMDYLQGKSEFFAVDSNHTSIPKYAYSLIKNAFEFIDAEYGLDRD